ncbi:MAG: hypothetical protein HXK19_00535 [Alloprevotella tannerae]|nr:hypothetical protein [Alloprevotella tannerae]
MQTAGRVIANVEGSFSRYALPLLLCLLEPNDRLVAAYDGLVRAYYRLPASNHCLPAPNNGCSEQKLLKKQALGIYFNAQSGVYSSSPHE